MAYSLWYVFGVAMLIPFVFIIRAITGYLSGYLMSYVSLDVLRRIKQDLFSRVQDYPLSFFDKHTTGDLFVRLTTDTQAVQTILLSFASEMIRSPCRLSARSRFWRICALRRAKLSFFWCLLRRCRFA